MSLLGLVDALTGGIKTKDYYKTTKNKIQKSNYYKGKNVWIIDKIYEYIDAVGDCEATKNICAALDRLALDKNEEECYLILKVSCLEDHSTFSLHTTLSAKTSLLSSASFDFSALKTIFENIEKLKQSEQLTQVPIIPSSGVLEDKEQKHAAKIPAEPTPLEVVVMPPLVRMERQGKLVTEFVKPPLTKMSPRQFVFTEAKTMPRLRKFTFMNTVIETPLIGEIHSHSSVPTPKVRESIVSEKKSEGKQQTFTAQIVTRGSIFEEPKISNDRQINSEPPKLNVKNRVPKKVHKIVKIPDWPNEFLVEMIMNNSSLRINPIIIDQGKNQIKIYISDNDKYSMLDLMFFMDFPNDLTNKIKNDLNNQSPNKENLISFTIDKLIFKAYLGLYSQMRHSMLRDMSITIPTMRAP